MSQRSDAEFLKELFETHRQTMYKIALGILHNSHDAEDVVQNAFLWISNNLEKISHIPCNERRYYFAKIIEHQTLNLIKKRQRHPESDIDEYKEINSGIFVDEAYLEKVTVEEIKQVIRTMSAADRLMLKLFLFEERSYKEIAGIAGITEVNARVSVHRARKRLAKLLKERGIDCEY